VHTAKQQASTNYSRHKPENTLLYKTIQNEFETFAATAAAR